MEAIWLEEKALHQEFKDAGKEARDILLHRKQEEGRVILDRSVFETARERAKAEASKVEEGHELVHWESFPKGRDRGYPNWNDC